MALNDPFFAGQTNYIEALEILRPLANLNEEQLSTLITGLLNILNGGGLVAENFADAVDPQQLTTLAQVNSLIGMGGNPGDIPINKLKNHYWYSGNL